MKRKPSLKEVIAMGGITADISALMDKVDALEKQTGNAGYFTVHAHLQDALTYSRDLEGEVGVTKLIE